MTLDHGEQRIVAIMLVVALWPTMIMIAGSVKATIGRTRPRTAEAVGSMLYWITFTTTILAGIWIGGGFE